MAKADIKLKPMLAASSDAEPGQAPKGLVYPLLVSPKLDGIRALRYNGQLVSRTLKPIPSQQAQRITMHLPEGIDGELIVGDPWQDPYLRTVSAVMKRSEVVALPDLRFYIFDNFLAPGGFYDRHKSLPDHTESIRVVPHTFVRTPEELLEMEQQFLNQGYEGLMIRSTNGPYKFGRATAKQGYLLKLKRFRDSEAVVLSCYERMHNANEAETNALGRTERSTKKDGLEQTGMLGGFHVRDVNKESEFYGVEFDVSSSTIPMLELGPMWKQRKNHEGKILVYKYFPTGSKDRPRFPTFKCWRPAIELV
jgi:DNA ligase 1